MAVREILTLSDDKAGILRKRAEDVLPEEIPQLQDTINDMLETVLHIGAIGLAAPQIGISKRLFVLEDGTVCINPSSIMGSGKITSHAEGCLSVDSRKRYNVKRIRNVLVRCLDRNGNPTTLRPNGLKANGKLYSIAIQHEIDHLNGVLICDKGQEQ